MLALKILFCVLLCVPLGYVGYLLFSRLMAEILKRK